MMIQETYEDLKRKLSDETGFHSNPNMWLRNRHYKAIVALGKPVVPFILGDLDRHLHTGKEEDYPGWWAMHALPDITGVQIKVGGPEVQVEGGFAKVSVADVSRFWLTYSPA